MSCFLGYSALRPLPFTLPVAGLRLLLLALGKLLAINMTKIVSSYTSLPLFSPLPIFIFPLSCLSCFPRLSWSFLLLFSLQPQISSINIGKKFVSYQFVEVCTLESTKIRVRELIWIKGSVRRKSKLAKGVLIP